MAETIGSVQVDITGDYSQLEADFDAAVAVAVTAGHTLAEAIEIASAQTSTYTDNTETATAATTQASSAAQEFARAEDTAAESTHHLSEGVADLGHELLQLAGLALTAEGLKELAESSVEAYGTEQQLAVSLQLMGASAEGADQKVEHLKEMSLDLAVPLDKLVSSARELSAAFGTGEGLDGALVAAANSSAATGRSFESVAASLERVQLTGQVSARQLVALGLSWEDMAKTMGTSVELAQLSLKKGGQTAAEDMADVLAAIQQKFGEAAHMQADTVMGEITQMKNRIEIMLSDLGEDFKNGVSGILEIVKGLVTAFEAFIGGIKLVADAFSAFFVATIAGFSALDKVMVDFFTGDFRRMARDVAEGSAVVQGAFKQGFDAMIGDALQNWAKINSIWADGEKKIAETPIVAPEGVDWEYTAIKAKQEHIKVNKDYGDSLAIIVAQEQLEIASHKALIQEIAKYNEQMGYSLDILGYFREKQLEAAEALAHLGEDIGPNTVALTEQDAVTTRLSNSMEKLAAAGVKAQQATLDKDKIHATTASLEQMAHQTVTLGDVYASLAQNVEHAFDRVGQSFAKALVQGKGFTDSMKAAVSGLAEAILSTLINAVIKMGEQWVLTMILGKATASAVDAGMVTGQAAISGAAGFASVMAALPFPVNVAVAPGVAAAATATVLGSYLPLATFTEGGMVPEDMFAMVHKGEHVFTADETQKALAGGGGGDSYDIKIQISGIVTQDVVKQLGEQIVYKIRQAAGNKQKF